MRFIYRNKINEKQPNSLRREQDIRFSSNIRIEQTEFLSRELSVDLIIIWMRNVNILNCISVLK